jgi:hypothetical protein
MDILLKKTKRLEYVAILLLCSNTLDLANISKLMKEVTTKGYLIAEYHQNKRKINAVEEHAVERMIRYIKMLILINN